MDWIGLGLGKWTFAQLWFHSRKEVTFVYFDSEYLPAKVRGGANLSVRLCVRATLSTCSGADVFSRKSKADDRAFRHSLIEWVDPFLCRSLRLGNLYVQVDVSQFIHAPVVLCSFCASRCWGFCVSSVTTFLISGNQEMSWNSAKVRDKSGKSPTVREKSWNLCSRGNLIVAAQQNGGNQTVVWTAHELWCAWTRSQIIK